MVPGSPGRRVRFVVGVTCIAASFLIYPAYVAIPFLPLSDTMKLVITVLGSLISWGTFGVGSYLSGREGYEWFKQRLRR